jgi:glucose-1-phosphate cytidylyltransferase
LKSVEPYVDGDTFLVTYGDGVCDIDIRRLVSFHQSHGRMATVTALRPLSRFGVLEMDHDGTVKGFREKPQAEEWINGGFFVFDRKVFDYLDYDSALEKAPLENLARDRQLVAYPHGGFWYAMDTYRDFLYLNELWNNGIRPWCVWGKACAGEDKQAQATGVASSSAAAGASG